jgi:hypothetical protein
VIDQRNAGASGTATGYTVDRWSYNATQSSKGTWQQNAGSVTPPIGFNFYQGITSSSAYSVVAGDYFFMEQSIEGFNFATNQYACIFNADYSFDPKYLKMMINKTKEYEFIFGSRYMKYGSSDDDTIITFIGNQIFTFLSKYTIDIITYNYLFDSKDFTNQQYDITNLRNIILSFILTYLYYFNNFNLNKFLSSNEFLKYNLDITDYVVNDTYISYGRTDDTIFKGIKFAISYIFYNTKR